MSRMTRLTARLGIIMMLAALMMPVLGTLPTNAAGNTSTYSLTATGKVNSKEGAFLRSKASKKSSKVAGLDNNTELVIVKEVFVTRKKTAPTKRWYYVKTGTRKGYIRADLVKDIKYHAVSAAAKKKTRCRAGAGTLMASKGTLKRGRQVTVLLKAKAYKSSKEWYKIKAGNKKYYVPAAYIKFAPKSEPDTTVATPSTTENVEFTLRDITYPEKVGEGSPFVLKGTISCSKKMSKVVGGITKSNGSWVTSVSTDVNDTTFNISTIDMQIKFGTLKKGSYIYKVDAYVDGRAYTQIRKDFSVVKPVNAGKITNKAFEVCWPAGTSSSRYKYGTSTGRATKEYKAALEEAYPDRSRWGAAPRAGASCDVLVGTVLRASGVDPEAPRGLDEQFPYYKDSGKYIRVDYNGDHSTLQSGDIILFSMKGGGAHTLIFLRKNGKEYIAEANHKHTYAYIVSNSSDINWRLKPQGKKAFYVYRING